MKFQSFICAFFMATSLFAQCDGTEPQFDFGPDTTLCPGQTLTLSVPIGYDYYLWTPSGSGLSKTINQPGTYGISAALTGSNLVINGDFEGGVTNVANNFTTSYTPGTGGAFGILSAEGQYAIATSPSLTHTNFLPCNDHTPGVGVNMMVVNGSGTANTTVWSQTLSVGMNQDYIFSFWVTNVLNNSNVAQLQLYINNIPISSIQPTSTSSCQWTQNTGIWNSGTATSAVLTIINQSTAVSGNDFAIDDIFFASNCLKQDSIVVSYDNVTVDAGPDLTFCANSSDTAIATTNSANNTLIWTVNGTPGASITPTQSGVYRVTAISPIGCTKTDSIVVNVKAMNWEITDIIVNPSNCGTTTGFVSALVGTVNSNLPPPLPFQFNWSGPGLGSPNSISASVFQNLAPGWYYLSVTSNGCTVFDSAQVLPSNAPIASFTASPAAGTAPVLVTFQNTSQSATNYTWFVGSGDSLNSTTLADVQHLYTMPGTYTVALIAYNGTCTDTAFQTIIVLEPPTLLPVQPVSIEVPNVFSPNGDKVNDAFTFQLENIVALEVIIFNRWGNVMYQTSDVSQFSWDGTNSSGAEAADGVYFYRYTARGLQSEELNGQGFFQLVR